MLIRTNGIEICVNENSPFTYGSYNNYLYCEEHGMEKYIKYTIFNETADNKYHDNYYRVTNFKRGELGNLICPNGQGFFFIHRQHIY